MGVYRLVWHRLNLPESRTLLFIAMNTLSSDVEIKGTISFTQQLAIEGKIEGNVASKGALVVGERGFVKGDVQTGSVVIFGRVEGNVTSQGRCEVKSSATIIGDIAAGSFSVEEGATFQGRSRVGKAAVGGA